MEWDPAPGTWRLGPHSPGQRFNQTIQPQKSLMQNETETSMLIESMREQTQLQPEDATAWYNLGVAHDMVGETEDRRCSIRRIKRSSKAKSNRQHHH